MDAHSCRYCEHLFVCLPKSAFSPNISGFRFAIDTVKAAVQAGCSFFCWAFDIDANSLPDISEPNYLDKHLARLPEIPANGDYDKLDRFEKFEGFPGSDTLESESAPYLTLYLRCGGGLQGGDLEGSFDVKIVIERSDDVSAGRIQKRLMQPRDHLKLAATDGSTLDFRITTKPIVRAPSSPESFALAQSWLDKCVQFHNHGRVSVHKLASARLIRVKRTSGGMVHANVANVTGSEVPAYLALSYCWGGDQQHKTTIGNIAAAQIRLDVSLMPKTIQDAITVTQTLGYNHLWVDSVCIMQDSEHDKITEIEKMPGIYSNSVCTISATSAENAWEGFLQDRMQDTDRVMRLGVRARRDGKFLEIDKVLAFPLKHFNDASALATRGWGLQERLLSHRILEYRRHQTRFLCPSTDYSDERHRDGWEIDSGFDLTAHIERHGFVKIAQLLNREIDDAENFHSIWKSVVEGYTWRHLTFAADRALAISGIAQRMAAIDRAGISTIYIAGNWLSLFPFNLSWSIRMSSSFLGRKGALDRTRRSPSWSWTSVNIPISFEHSCQRWKSLARLIDHNVNLRDGNAPFGDVRSATLTISAPVLSTQSRPASSTGRGDREFILSDVTQPHGTIHLDDPFESPATSCESLLVILLKEALEVTTVDEFISGDMSGIVVVEENADHGPRRFRRLGFWKLEDRDWTPEWARMIDDYTRPDVFETFVLV